MAKESTTTETKPRGRYRKVEVRTWGDERFRALTPIPPCGQGLWLYLITGPHTGPIPGLFRAGRAGMAEDLNWELEAFDEAFREAFAQGMVEADFKARVVWVPNAIKHNRPESPNVVRSWSAEFDLIPECDLKRQAYESLKASIHALGEAFAKAFDESFAKPSVKPSVKAMPKTMPNQEQEQEQEQEQDKDYPCSPRSEDRDLVGDRRVVDKPDPLQPILDAYHQLLPKCERIAVLNPKRRKRLLAAIKLAKSVCKSQQWPYDAGGFWAAYFGECATDPWMRGEVPNPKNLRWRQNLDVLLAEDRFAGVMDRAIGAMRGDA